MLECMKCWIRTLTINISSWVSCTKSHNMLWHAILSAHDICSTHIHTCLSYSHSHCYLSHIKCVWFYRVQLDGSIESNSPFLTKCAFFTSLCTLYWEVFKLLPSTTHSTTLGGPNEELKVSVNWGGSVSRVETSENFMLGSTTGPAGEYKHTVWL